MDAAMKNAVLTAYNDCLSVKKTESVLIVTDDDTFAIGQAFYQVGKSLVKKIHLIVMPTAKVNGEEPSDEIAHMMQSFDVVVCPTRRSLTHTDAKRNACKKGARVATLPGITEDVFVRTLQADYTKIAERTEALSALLKNTKTVKIKTALGTDLTLPIQGMPPISSTGLVREAGKGGNIPSGESFLAPREGEAQGVLMVDASIAGLGMVDDPVKIEIKDGFAHTFSGGKQAAELEKELKAFGKPGLNVAELGIGTNDSAEITGKILEDEKVFGTIHIAFGNNISMGGTCNVGIHIDCVVTKPDIWFDDEHIMQAGTLLIKDKF